MSVPEVKQRQFLIISFSFYPAELSWHFKHAGSFFSITEQCALETHFYKAWSTLIPIWSIKSSIFREVLRQPECCVERRYSAAPYLSRSDRLTLHSAITITISDHSVSIEGTFPLHQNTSVSCTGAEYKDADWTLWSEHRLSIWRGQRGVTPNEARSVSMLQAGM